MGCNYMETQSCSSATQKSHVQFTESVGLVFRCCCCSCWFPQCLECVMYAAEEHLQWASHKVSGLQRLVLLAQKHVCVMEDRCKTSETFREQMPNSEIRPLSYVQASTSDYKSVNTREWAFQASALKTLTFTSFYDWLRALRTKPAAMKVKPAELWPIRDWNLVGMYEKHPV